MKKNYGNKEDVHIPLADENEFVVYAVVKKMPYSG